MDEYKIRPPLTRFVSAWLLTAVCDGAFSSFLSAIPYNSTVARLWQGVASMLLGPTAIDGGNRPVVIGILMHFGVAFTWTAIFMLVLMPNRTVTRMLASPFGVAKAASLYGPIIWTVMSFLVIPQFSHKPTVVTYKWWIQFFGHIPFVAVPMIAMLARGAPTLRPKDPPLENIYGDNHMPDGSHIDPDGQINALLTNKAYQYVAERLRSERIPSGGYPFVFTVRRADIESYLGRNGLRPEDFGAKFHWLSLHHVDDKWIVREFIPPEKSPGFDDDTPFDTYDAARAALLTKLLRNTQTNIQF